MKKKSLFDQLNFNERSGWIPGIQARIKFPNGYGASVIQNEISYGNREGLFEIAVLDHNGDLCYTTPITSDVIGFLTPERVTNVLARIKALPTNKALSNKPVLNRRLLKALPKKLIKALFHKGTEAND